MAKRGFQPMRKDGNPINPSSLEFIRKAWAEMRVYLGRRYPKFTFIAVVEFQPRKTGNAHLHILVGRWIPKEWVKKAWRSVGGGNSYIEFVKPEDIPFELSKYLTKTKLSGMPKGKRAITTSRDLKLKEPPVNPGWKLGLADISMYFHVSEFVARGGKIQVDEHGLQYFELRDGQQSELQNPESGIWNRPPEHIDS